MKTDQQPTATIFRRQPLSRREMAAIPHTLSSSGDIATTEDGRQYLWCARFQQWTPWK